MARLSGSRGEGSSRQGKDVADRATIGDSIGGVGPRPSSHFPTIQSDGLSDQQLAEPEGYGWVENGDRKHVAPGAETIRELFGGEPALIMIDDVSVDLRKVERANPGAGEEFTAVLQALIKAVESSIRRTWRSGRAGPARRPGRRSP